MNTEQNKLAKKDKEAIGLLSIGTFLEYFDLYLYVHMAVLLNDLFFPKGDPLMKQLITALTFCSTYIMRPIGGIIIGWIGDKYGRKSTIVITTTIMAFCCLIMAALPTYDEIGIAASIILLTCRMLQGFSSLGECVGTKLYLVEMLKSPSRNVVLGFIGAFIQLGGTIALVIISFSTNIASNWRYAFLAGCVIALVGVVARTRLRETPDFINYQSDTNVSEPIKSKYRYFFNTSKKVALLYFFTKIIFTFPFYVIYVYIGDIMRNKLGYTAEEVIQQNLKVSVLTVLGMMFISILAKKFHPIKISFATTSLFIIFLPFLPYWINNITNELSLLCLQYAVFLLALPSYGLLESVIYKHFPMNNRFLYIATTFGISSPIARIIPAFGLIPLTYYFGNYALFILFAPSIILVFYGLYYFKNLEIKSGNYCNYPYKDDEVEEDLYNYNYELKKEYKPFKKECKYSSKLLEMIESINKTARVPVNIKLVKKAIAFAKKWHDGQMRKTGEPYYTHPLAVAMMTAQYKYKTYMIVSAILHDVVEDSDCTVELIAKEFNPRIAEIVKLLTREEENRKLTIAESMKKIFDAKDYDALLIKGLDRLHNLQTIRGMKPEKRRKIAEETIYEIANIVAYAVDDLNINNKNKLEKKLYKLSNKALKSAMNNS